MKTGLKQLTEEMCKATLEFGQVLSNFLQYLIFNCMTRARVNDGGDNTNTYSMVKMTSQ